MVIVLIRRSVKREKEAEFLATYDREKPNHPYFLEETLTNRNPTVGASDKS